MAQNKTVKRIEVYIGTKKIIECETSKYGHNSNDEQGHGLDGAVYFSTGNGTTTLDFNTITPYLGHEATSLKNGVIKHLDVDMTVFVDGGIEKVSGRLTGREYDSDSKTGMVKCSWKFAGGEPTVL